MREKEGRVGPMNGSHAEREKKCAMPREPIREEWKDAPAQGRGAFEMGGLEAACVALAAAAGGTLLAFARDVHREVATLVVALVHLADRRLGAGVVRHHDETEAAGAAGVAIGDEGGFAHGSGLAEEFAEVALGGVEGKIPDVEFGGHCSVSDISRLLWLTPVVGLKSPLSAHSLAAGKKQLATYHALLRAHRSLH